MQELETLVCGEKYVSIDLLRRHTRYADGVDPNAEYIKWFWEILTEFSQDEWAQRRLPADDSEFVAIRTRFMLKPVVGNLSDHDEILPRAVSFI